MSGLDALRREVLEANLELVRRGLVVSSFGNASGIDREAGVVVIKPSGVAYDQLTPEHLVVTDLEGHLVEGNLRPSSDLPTHIALYRAFRRSAGSPTPTRATPPPGRRRGARSPAWEPRTPTTSRGRSRSPSR